MIQTVRESQKFTGDCVLAKGSTQFQTLGKTVRDPLMPKIDWINNRGNNYDMFTVFHVYRESFDTVRDIGPHRPGSSVCVHRDPYPSAQ